MRAIPVLVLGSVAVFGVACAKGDSDSLGGFAQIGSGAGGQGGSVGSTGANMTGTTSGPGTSTTTTTSTGMGGAGTGGAGTGGSGVGGDNSSTTTTGTGGSQPACDYTSPNTCDAGDSLGVVDGDQNMDVQTASGSTSQWFTIDINEGDSSIISYPALSYTVTLQSTGGTQFDLYVYEGDNSGPNCQAAAKQGAGSPETVSDKWSDTPISDDSKYLAIEVRYVSGSTCDASSMWNLTVAGHTM